MLSVFSTRLAGFPTETHLLLPTFIFIILYTGWSWILFLVFSNSCGFITILLPAIVLFLFESSSINFVPSAIYSYLFFLQNTIVFLKNDPFFLWIFKYFLLMICHFPGIIPQILVYITVFFCIVMDSVPCRLLWPWYCTELSSQKLENSLHLPSFTTPLPFTMRQLSLIFLCILFF